MRAVEGSMIKRFEKGEALHKGRWTPVTTFLVVTEHGSEWCCLNGWHSRDSKEVEQEKEISVRLLAEGAFNGE